MQYTCTLRLNKAADAVHTEWSPNTPDPKEFVVGDEILFTSVDGDWRVEFVDSPFASTTVPQTFSAPVDQPQTGSLLRDGQFNFDCIIVSGGKAIGYDGAGDDLRVRK